jgi:hypothetical protein
MFRFTEPSSGQFLKTQYWYIHSHSLRTRSASAQSMGVNVPVLCFQKLAWGWFSEPKHVSKFLILITNICCVTEWINYCIVEVYLRESDGTLNISAWPVHSKQWMNLKRWPLFRAKAKLVEVPTHYMMGCEGSRCITPLIPNLATKWKWGVRIILRSSYHQEGNPVPTQHDAGCAPERVWIY